MKRIVVEAFEDPSRPNGGHAVILLREVGTIPDRPSIRLRPVETELGGDRSGLWRGGRLQPLATRSTVAGIELVVGPDVVGNPHLIAGTPVIIEIAEADVRGEFLWPSVAPLAAPRRRRVIVPRTGARVLPMPAAANDAAGSALDTLAEPKSGPDANAVQPASLSPDVEPPSAPPAPADANAAAVLQVLAEAAAAAPDATSAASLPAVATEKPDDAPTAPAAIEDMNPAPARAAQAGEPDWTPDAAQRQVQRRRFVRYVLGAAAALALATVWMKRGAVDPDMQLSEKYARPPAAAATSDAVAPGTNGSPGKPSDGKAIVTAAGPAAVAAIPPASPCGAPEIKTEAMLAGRMRVGIDGKCAARQSVHFRYGGADQVVQLDGKGSSVFILDAFAGDAEPLLLEFNDGRRDSVPVTVKDLDRVSKMAVIWSSPVDLDLHAFEYAALPGGKGHIWSGAAGSLDDALRAIGADKRGHGFLSASADARANGDRVEVYSFMHADEQASGSVGLALDYATRGETPDGDTCGTGRLAEIPYALVVRPRGGPARRESGIIAAAACGGTLGPEVRYRQAALPVLKIKK